VLAEGKYCVPLIKRGLKPQFQSRGILEKGTQEWQNIARAINRWIDIFFNI